MTTSTLPHWGYLPTVKTRTESLAKLIQENRVEGKQLRLEVQGEEPRVLGTIETIVIRPGTIKMYTRRMTSKPDQQKIHFTVFPPDQSVKVRNKSTGSSIGEEVVLHAEGTWGDMIFDY